MLGTTVSRFCLSYSRARLPTVLSPLSSFSSVTRSYSNGARSPNQHWSLPTNPYQPPTPIAQEPVATGSKTSKEKTALLKFLTVREGEQVYVWDKKGQGRIVKGPGRQLLIRSTYANMNQYVAGNREYLQVEHKDGTTEVIPGPCTIYENPATHIRIQLFENILINTNESIVVYSRTGQGIERKTVVGPTAYIPKPGEWTHNFSWHGAAPTQPDKKVRGGLQFTKLRLMPDQMYHDVESVRTADDAMVTVKLMIFFHLVDVEKMLDKTHDPIADFINSVCADVLDFSSTCTFQTFKEKTNMFNNIATFPHLVQRAKMIGYEIDKVVFRGYSANPQLQLMHDMAIEERTRLQLQLEKKEQEQKLIDYEMNKDHQRKEEVQKMEHQETIHKNELAKIKLTAELENSKSKTLADLENYKLREDAAQTFALQKQQNELAYNEQLKAMGVDLTPYLVSKNQTPTKLIKIEGGNSKVKISE